MAIPKASIGKKASHGVDPSDALPKEWLDPYNGYNQMNVSNPYIPSGNPDDDKSDLDKVRESDLRTVPMISRDKLRLQAINAAAKVGKGYRDFDTPVQPDEFGTPMTDGFGYC